MIVLEAVVLVPAEHHAAGSGGSGAGRERVRVDRRQNPGGGGGAGSLAGPAEHFSESVRGQAST